MFEMETGWQAWGVATSRPPQCPQYVADVMDRPGMYMIAHSRRRLVSVHPPEVCYIGSVADGSLRARLGEFQASVNGADTHEAGVKYRKKYGVKLGDCQIRMHATSPSDAEKLAKDFLINFLVVQGVYPIFNKSMPSNFRLPTLNERLGLNWEW